MTAMMAALALMAGGAAPAQVPSSVEVRALALQAMADTGAKGLAVAVIDEGQIASVQAFGSRNAAGAPLAANTVMYGASLTKALFAYTLMQLVEEGRVDLDRPVAGYLAKPLPEYGNVDAYGNWGDLAGDERWRAITPRILLTHSAGFANFRGTSPTASFVFTSIPVSATHIRARASSCCSLRWRRGSGSRSARRCSAGCSTASAWRRRA